MNSLNSVLYRVHLNGYAAEIIRNKKTVANVFGKPQPNIKQLINKNLIDELSFLEKQNNELMELVIEQIKSVPFSMLVFKMVKSYIEKSKIRLCKESPIHVPVRLSREETEFLDDTKKDIEDMRGHEINREHAIAELIQECEFLTISNHYLKEFLIHCNS